MGGSGHQVTWLGEYAWSMGQPPSRSAWGCAEATAVNIVVSMPFKAPMLLTSQRTPTVTSGRQD